jgi:hypothetical protein
MRSPASARGLLLLAVVALGAATGCNAYLANEGDPAAPILVQGRVVDSSGGGMSGARIQVHVAEPNDMVGGVTVTNGYEATFSAGLDGTFVVRLAPSPALIAKAGASGTMVTVTLTVFANETPFAFRRELRNGTWAGAVPAFVFGPEGVIEPSGNPGTPAPAPIGT